MSDTNETEFQPLPVKPRVLSALSTLPAAERRVADAVLDEPDAIHRSSIGQVGDMANTSPPTVVRFARRLGYRGFTDLKMALAADRGRAAQFGRPPTQSLERAPLDQAVADDVAALDAMATCVTPQSFEQAAAALSAAPQVFFVGAGSSAALAELAVFRFLALGLDARTHRDPLQFDLELERAPEGSTLLAISHTGATRTTLHAVRSAHARDFTTIGISSHAKSELAELADIVLVTGSATRAHRLDMFTNRIEHVSVLGALHDACARSMTRASTDSAHVAARHMD
ncbi:MAG: MurR/RpiR family transcriptional regulator [Actinomycetota bacterium]